MAAADTGDLPLFNTVAHAVDWTIGRQPLVRCRSPSLTPRRAKWGRNSEERRRNPLQLLSVLPRDHAGKQHGPDEESASLCG